MPAIAFFVSRRPNIKHRGHGSHRPQAEKKYKMEKVGDDLAACGFCFSRQFFERQDCVSRDDVTPRRAPEFDSYARKSAISLG
ncbi:protein of unknown function [Thiomonas sp. OC7]|nr:protein of unknown function [Thiomonas sp. OC7]